MITVLGVELKESMSIDQAIKEMNKRGIFGSNLPNHIAKVVLHESKNNQMIQVYSDKSAEDILVECC